MRLSDRIQNIIKKAALQSFGEVDIYLFGSRADNNKKGGDIDLAVNTKISDEEFRKQKIQFLSALLMNNFDLKIDLVKYPCTDQLLQKEIQKNSIKLM